MPSNLISDQLRKKIEKIEAKLKQNAKECEDATGLILKINQYVIESEKSGNSLKMEMDELISQLPNGALTLPTEFTPVQKEKFDDFTKRILEYSEEVPKKASELEVTYKLLASKLDRATKLSEKLNKHNVIALSEGVQKITARLEAELSAIEKSFPSLEGNAQGEEHQNHNQVLNEPAPALLINHKKKNGQIGLREMKSLTLDPKWLPKNEKRVTSSPR